MKLIYRRRFLLEDLPAPLTRASEHLQFFDNYLTETRLLLRQIRTPKTREWRRAFVQEYASAPDLSKFSSAEIELSEYEYEVLSVFEGNELRYNRYFTEIDEREWQVDLILNRELWNLVFAAVEFASAEEMRNFSPPDFILREVTNDEFFLPERLVHSTLAEVRNKVESQES